MDIQTPEQPVRECPSCPWMGLLRAYFKCRIIAVIRHLWRPLFCCPNPFPSPVMLQARPSPGPTRSARPPGPGTPSGPTSVTGPAFTRWAQEQGLDLPGGLEAALCDYLVRLAEDGKRSGHHPAGPGGHHHGDIYLALTAEQSVDKYIRQS